MTTYYDPREKLLLNPPMDKNDIRRFWRVAVLANKIGVPRTTLQSACWHGFLKHEYTACGCLMTTLEWVWEWQQTRKFKDSRLTTLPTVDTLTTTGGKQNDPKRVRAKRNPKDAQQRNPAKQNR